ncbi:hypothetical protein [Lutibaculum baratangense]|nr:hypothetical protein [Lutibaculum baratangense]
MTMRLSDLIERLQDLAAECDTDPEVQLAVQPSWPFAHRLTDVVLVDLDADDDEPPSDVTAYAPPRRIVYLGKGGQIGYLPGIAKAELGW